LKKVIINSNKKARNNKKKTKYIFLSNLLFKLVWINFIYVRVNKEIQKLPRSIKRRKGFGEAGKTLGKTNESEEL